VSWHADDGALLELTKDIQIWKTMSEYSAAPVSSEMEMVLGGGKEYAMIEAVGVMRPEEARAAARGDRATASDRVYLDGRRRAGLNLGPTCPNLGSDFFIFEKRFWVSTGNNRYEK
jgi:hypothetical protein